MTWDLINIVSTYSSIWANFTTILTWIITLLLWIPAFLYFFWWKKYKSIIVSSKTFLIPLENEDIKKSVYPSKIYDENINFSYDNNLQSPSEFCNVNLQILSEVKEKYNPICVFWIAEMFIFFWIWYYLQDSIHIRWFRKLKNDIIKFSWNPWSWTGLFSLKWFLYFKWLYKSIFNRYNNPKIDYKAWEEINLIINISFKVNKNNIPEELLWLSSIDFWIKKTDPAFLINENQVYTFSKKIKSIMHDLDHQLWSWWKINIFCTLPVPFLIKLWQSIHRNWPECVFYDLDRELWKYTKIISTKDFII